MKPSPEFSKLKDFVKNIVSVPKSEIDAIKGLENFWSLLKRGINGTYVSIEPFHLHRYLDEQTFRYNNRKNMGDGARFVKALSCIGGKRLTLAELTGKEATN